MGTSTFQNLRAALATLITARFTTDAVTGVTVFQYPPSGTQAREDMVWFGRITVDQEPLTMGGTGRGVDELLTVDFRIAAPRNGGTQTEAAAAETRAETILASVENAVRADSTVGGTVMFAEVDTFESTPTFDELGFVGVIEGTISCQANL